MDPLSDYESASDALQTCQDFTDFSDDELFHSFTPDCLSPQSHHSIMSFQPGVATLDISTSSNSADLSDSSHAVPQLLSTISSTQECTSNSQSQDFLKLNTSFPISLSHFHDSEPSSAATVIFVGDKSNNLSPCINDSPNNVDDVCNDNNSHDLLVFESTENEMEDLSHESVEAINEEGQFDNVDVNFIETGVYTEQFAVTVNHMEFVHNVGSDLIISDESLEGSTESIESPAKEQNYLPDFADEAKLSLSLNNSSVDSETDILECEVKQCSTEISQNSELVDFCLVQSEVPLVPSPKEQGLILSVSAKEQRSTLESADMVTDEMLVDDSLVVEDTTSALGQIAHVHDDLIYPCERSSPLTDEYGCAQLHMEESFCEVSGLPMPQVVDELMVDDSVSYFVVVSVPIAESNIPDSTIQDVTTVQGLPEPLEHITVTTENIDPTENENAGTDLNDDNCLTCTISLNTLPVSETVDESQDVSDVVVEAITDSVVPECNVEALVREEPRIEDQEGSPFADVVTITQEQDYIVVENNRDVLVLNTIKDFAEEETLLHCDLIAGRGSCLMEIESTMVEDILSQDSLHHGCDSTVDSFELDTEVISCEDQLPIHQESSLNDESSCKDIICTEQPLPDVNELEAHETIIVDNGEDASQAEQLPELVSDSFVVDDSFTPICSDQHDDPFEHIADSLIVIDVTRQEEDVCPNLFGIHPVAATIMGERENDGVDNIIELPIPIESGYNDDVIVGNETVIEKELTVQLTPHVNETHHALDQCLESKFDTLDVSTEDAIGVDGDTTHLLMDDVIVDYLCEPHDFERNEGAVDSQELIQSAVSIDTPSLISEHSEILEASTVWNEQITATPTSFDTVHNDVLVDDSLVVENISSSSDSQSLIVEQLPADHNLIESPLSLTEDSHCTQLHIDGLSREDKFSNLFRCDSDIGHDQSHLFINAFISEKQTEAANEMLDEVLQTDTHGTSALTNESPTTVSFEDVQEEESSVLQTEDVATFVQECLIASGQEEDQLIDDVSIFNTDHSVFSEQEIVETQLKTDSCLDTTPEQVLDETSVDYVYSDETSSCAPSQEEILVMETEKIAVDSYISLSPEHMSLIDTCSSVQTPVTTCISDSEDLSDTHQIQSLVVQDLTEPITKDSVVIESSDVLDVNIAICDGNSEHRSKSLLRRFFCCL
ncbi:hypothetical protein RCL1_000781 [Eukaryota sp. TZLM3-RCL]